MRRTTVANCLKRAGVKQSRQRVMAEDDIDQTQAAYLAGESWGTIALRFDVEGVVPALPTGIVPAVVAATICDAIAHQHPR